MQGTRAVLEVRANEMPILLEDDQFVGRLNYFYMSEKPEKIYGKSIGSNYQLQGLALSKQFKREQFTFSSDTSNKVADHGSDQIDDRRDRSQADSDEEGDIRAPKFAYQNSEAGFPVVVKEGVS